MKRLLLIIVLGVLCLHSQADELSPRSYNQIFEECYGEIRANMFRDACRIAGYTNQEVLDQIENKSVVKFMSALAGDPIEDDNLSQIRDDLRTVLQNSDQSLKGTNIEKYDKNINKICTSLAGGLMEHFLLKGYDISDTYNRYRTDIERLTKECKTFEESTTDNHATYFKQYPEGHFLELVPDEVKNPPVPIEVETKPSVDTHKTSVRKYKSSKRGGLLTFVLKFFKYMFIILVILVLGVILILKSLNANKKKSVQLLDSTSTRSTPTPTPSGRVTSSPSATVPTAAPQSSSGPEPLEEVDSDVKSQALVESEIKSCGAPTIAPIFSNAKPTTQPILPKGEVNGVPVQCKAFAQDAGEWIIVGASVQGNGHVSTNLPCQDSSGYRYIGNGWGIAITSDGAGSKSHSDIGSAIAVQRGLDHFEALIKGIGWMTNNELPSETEWNKLAYHTLKAVRDDTKAFAKKNNVEFDSLSATIIVVIHSPKGLLVCHIGDGRAGYRDPTGHWHPAITPHGGEECNQTIFIPMEFWDTPYYEQSGVMVPEARVIAERVTAFTLMSDGCEKTAFKCDVMNPETGIQYDPNQPHEAFFESVIGTLRSFREDGEGLDERKAKWAKFLHNGIEKLAIETDDKTMIVAAVAL